jgi:hypothetical protein
VGRTVEHYAHDRTCQLLSRLRRPRAQANCAHAFSRRNACHACDTDRPARFMST